MIEGAVRRGVVLVEMMHMALDGLDRAKGGVHWRGHGRGLLPEWSSFDQCR